MLVLAIAAVAGCGGGSKKQAPAQSGKPDAAAKAVAQEYLDAYTARDPRTVCQQLSAQVRSQLSGRHTCAKAVKATIVTSYPRLRIKQAYADGSSATATVVGSARRVQLRRERDAWKVSNAGN